MSDEKAERQPFVWGCTGGIRDYNSKELPFFEWIAHQTTTEKFIVPKEDPRMDMGRNSEHYSDPTPGTACLVMVSALVPILRQTAELAGFEIIGRIPLRDKATGKEYR